MRYTISIGSNHDRRNNLAWARGRLADYFQGIRFSVEEDTEPLFLQRTDLFANQVACFVSDLSVNEVVACLKDIEREAGRKPSDKKQEIVILDLDVLAVDEVVFRPKDLEREYVQRGIRFLEAEVK